MFFWKRVERNPPTPLEIFRKMLTTASDAVVGQALSLRPKKTDLLSLTISSTTMRNDACKWLGLNFKPGESRKKSHIVQFPSLKTHELKWESGRKYEGLKDWRNTQN